MLLWLGTAQAPTLAGSYVQVSQTGGTVTDDDGYAAYADGGPFAYGYVAYGYGATGYGTNGWGILPENPAKCSDEITTTFQWQPSFPGEPPPNQVVVHESVDVGYGDANIPWYEAAQGQCDDGFGDPEVDYLPNGPGPFICRRQMGDHYTVKPGGPTVTVHCSPSASASVDDDADTWTCWVAYNVDLSTPFVTLHRDGAHDETVDPDETVHGDTTYSYKEIIDFTTNDRANWQYFHPSVSGYWHQATDSLTGITYYDWTWKWDPDESDDDFDTGQWKVPYGTVNYNYDTPQGTPDSPQTKDISFTVTDNQDGATASAHYKLTVHDQVEPFTPDHSVGAWENTRQVGGDLKCTSTGQSLGGGVTAEVSYSLSASFGGPIGEFIATMTGLNMEAEASNAWSYTSSVSATDIPVGYYSYLEMQDHYYYHDGIVQTYDTGGYTGTHTYNIKEIPKSDGDRWGIQMHQPYLYSGAGDGRNP